jgi:hypothetical protein
MPVATSEAEPRDSAEVVSSPHFTGANLIDSIGRWGGPKIKKAITGKAIISYSDTFHVDSLRDATIR